MSLTDNSPTGFMDVASVGRELGLDELGVMRLLARQDLKATRVGLDGPWRVAAAEVGRYIGAGAIGVKPVSAIGGRWFNDNAEQGAAEGVANAVLGVAMAQVPEKLAPEQLAKHDLPLFLTPAITALLDMPVQEPSWVRLPGPSPLDHFKTNRELYVAMGIRAMAARELQEGRYSRDGFKSASVVPKMLDAPIRTLYQHGQPVYNEIATNAATRFLAGGISMSKLFSVPSGHPGIPAEQKRIFFTLPHTAIANKAQIVRAYFLAF